MNVACNCPAVVYEELSYDVFFAVWVALQLVCIAFNRFSGVGLQVEALLLLQHVVLCDDAAYVLRQDYLACCLALGVNLPAEAREVFYSRLGAVQAEPSGSEHSSTMAASITAAPSMMKTAPLLVSFFSPVTGHPSR